MCVGVGAWNGGSNGGDASTQAESAAAWGIWQAGGFDGSWCVPALQPPFLLCPSLRSISCSASLTPPLKLPLPCPAFPPPIEQDLSTRRNAFHMLAEHAQEKAVTYMFSQMDRVADWGDILQIAVLDLIRKVGWRAGWVGQVGGGADRCGCGCGMAQMRGQGGWMVSMRWPAGLTNQLLRTRVASNTACTPPSSPQTRRCAAPTRTRRASTSRSFWPCCSPAPPP